MLPYVMLEQCQCWLGSNSCNDIHGKEDNRQCANYKRKTPYLQHVASIQTLH